MKKYLCFDIGGTTIKYGLATKEGTLLEHNKIPTKAKEEGGSGIILRIKNITNDYLKKEELSGIAISTAGMVDPKRGYIFYALPDAIPNYTDTPLKEIMEREFSLRCSVENDVNCAALGEIWKGAGKNTNSAFCLTVGTSIGGAVIINNKIWHGISNSAGEIAYMNLPNGKAHDIISTVQLIKNTAKFEGIDENLIDGKIVFKWAKENRASALKSINILVDNLSDCICNICNVLNPEIIILGGGIMEQEEYLRPLIEKSLEKKLVKNVFIKTKLSFASLKNTAGMIGALYHFLSEE